MRNNHKDQVASHQSIHIQMPELKISSSGLKVPMDNWKQILLFGPQREFYAFSSRNDKWISGLRTRSSYLLQSDATSWHWLTERGLSITTTVRYRLPQFQCRLKAPNAWTVHSCGGKWHENWKWSSKFNISFVEVHALCIMENVEPIGVSHKDCMLGWWE